jgi:hypothetical protein
MSDKKKNTIVVLEPCAKSAKELLGIVEEKALAEVVRVATVEEALQTIAQALPCIFVASINDNSDVPTRVQLFKRLEGAIKTQGLKIFVVTPIKNRQLSDMVTQKMGVADYIVEPIPARTMQFKLNLQLKAVDNFRRQQELKKAAAEAVVIKKLDNTKKDNGPAGNEVKTNGKPALQAGEDTFLFKNSGVKKTGKKFTVELEGPAPETGEWVPHEDKGDPTPAWRWVPNEEKEAQAKGEIPPDGWVHKGDKPQFVDESQKWAMSSEKPSLALRKKGAVAAEKIGTDEAGEVFVAEDSAAAEENISKNRAKAALLKPNRAKKSLKNTLGGLEEPEELAAAEGSTAVDPANGDPKKIRNKAGKGDKLSALKNLLGDGNGEDEGVSAGELQNKLTPDEPGKAAVLKDKRGKDETHSAFNALKDAEEESEEAPSGPLAFLKKKQGEQARAEVARLKADPLPEGVNPLEENDGEEADPAAPRGLKKKKPKAKSDALARLAQSLSQSDEISEPEAHDAAEVAPEEESEEREASKALRADKLKVARDPLASLRDDPASERGELNDLQEKGTTKEKLRAERKKSAAAMQALLEEPLPETLPPSEEEALRAELGLKNRPDVSVKDLSRKKRLKNAKSIKDRLAELDAELSAEEELGDTFQAGVSRDDPEGMNRTTGDLNADKLRGIRGAFDNEQTAEELDEERKRLKTKHEADRKRSANKDKAIYIPQDEIQPLGNAWESSGTHYAYLASTVRYRGFDKLDDLLPLWYFDGDDAPVLLDKTKQWRFLGSRPVQANTVAEIPAPVRDFLIGLRDQLLLNEGSAEPETTEVESVGDDGKKGKLKSKEESKFDKLKAMFADEEDGKETADIEDESAGDGKEKQGRKGEEETHDKNDLRGKKSESDSKFDKLKAMFDDEEEKETKDDAVDPLERLRAKLGMDEEEEQKDSYSAKLAEQPGLQGEGVKKFLEKRKNKAEAATPEAAPKRSTAPAPGYLGVFVALSDAYANQANPPLALSRVLGSLQDAFKNCIVCCTGNPDGNGMAEVRYHSPLSGKPTEKLSLSSGLSEPIQNAAGGGSEVLGYLYIGKHGERESFSDAEEITFRSMATKLWPLLTQAIAASNKEAA